jgi:hypothetical protein
MYVISLKQFWKIKISSIFPLGPVHWQAFREPTGICCVKLNCEHGCHWLHLPQGLGFQETRERTWLWITVSQIRYCTLAVRKSSAQILLQWVTMSLVQWSPTHTHTHTHTILKPHALWSVTSKVQARWNPSLRERPKKLFSRNTGLVRKLASQGTEVQGQTATSSPNPKSQ